MELSQGLGVEDKIMIGKACNKSLSCLMIESLAQDLGVRGRYIDWQVMQ